MPISAHLLAISLGFFLGTGAMAAKHSSVQIRCSAVGAKLVAPAMSPEAVCSRFIAAFGGSASATLHDGLAVDLTFRPPGVMVANVTRLVAGRPQPQQRFELAVSDRTFRLADIDRLAADVAAAMSSSPGR